MLLAAVVRRGLGITARPGAGEEWLRRRVEGRPLGALADEAVAHRVANALYAVLRELDGADPGATARLADAYERSVRIHMRALASLEWLRTPLEAAGVPWLVLKGPALAEHAGHRADLRAYEDLDLLVPAARFSRAVEALEDAGARLLDGNWELIRAEGRAQLHLRLPSGILVDLHWHPLNRAAVRHAFRIDVAELFERAAVAAGADGAGPRTIGLADTIVHTGLHAGLAGAQRLSWLEDVARLALLGPDWDEVVRRAREWRASRLVGIVLLRAHAVLGAPVPVAVLDALRPPALLRPLATAAPAPQARWRRLATSCIRDSARETALAVAGRGAASRRLRREAVADGGGHVPPVLRARHGPAGRDAYLAELRRSITATR